MSRLPACCGCFSNQDAREQEGYGRKSRKPIRKQIYESQSNQNTTGRTSMQVNAQTGLPETTFTPSTV